MRYDRLSDEDFEEAYARVFEDRPSYSAPDEISEEEFEEAYDALFGSDGPYREGGAYDVSTREQELEEARDLREKDERLSDDEVEEALGDLFA